MSLDHVGRVDHIRSGRPRHEHVHTTFITSTMDNLPDPLLNPLVIPHRMRTPF